MKLFKAMIFFFALLTAHEARAQSTGFLFLLERSKNANQVYYEARITREGVLDPAEPIHVFWVNRVKDSTGNTREELSVIERNMVYGCKLNKRVDGKYVSMTVVSYPDRLITVSLQNGKPVAEIAINGQSAYLDKIFISYRETRMFPKVNYIELFGRSIKTDEAQYEKIKIK
jgi:hypothetical protein